MRDFIVKTLVHFSSCFMFLVVFFHFFSVHVCIAFSFNCKSSLSSRSIFLLKIHKLFSHVITTYFQNSKLDKCEILSAVIFDHGCEIQVVFRSIFVFCESDNG